MKRAAERKGRLLAAVGLAKYIVDRVETGKYRHALVAGRDLVRDLAWLAYHQMK